ncbi:MAG TPA: serine/threonine-protein kinase [Gemmatimonadales bacterium]|nr:serine/threonine-protein kinase [Gemmatimonadales bacterium]
MSLDLDTLRRRLQKALGKQFTVGDLLGEGGFAAVFRVHDVAQNRDVAVKVLDLGMTPSPGLAERFVREARTSAQLEHPHIVPIYKVGGYKNEVLYIVMRCVDGPSVRQLLERHQRLSVVDAARIARQVADALGYAHARGIVHRDVKPDNVLVDGSGHVLVTDFGIAKAAQEASASQLTTEGMVVGTPHYMSPEQATGERVDQRSDIYALGVVLYQMLSGTPPFDGESAQSVLMKQATAEPEPIRRLRNDVPATLAAVIERMLAKDPADRYQTAEAVSQALVAALPGAARDAVHPGQRVALTAARVLLGLAVAAGVVVVWLALFAQPPRVSVSAPVPDTLTHALRRRGALSVGDTPLYVFVPRGADDTTLLLVARRTVAVVTAHRLRVYPRDSVRVRYSLNPRHGAVFRMILSVPQEREDTAFQRLSVRDVYAMTPRLRQLLGSDSTRVDVRLSP